MSMTHAMPKPALAAGSASTHPDRWYFRCILVYSVQGPRLPLETLCIEALTGISHQATIKIRAIRAIIPDTARSSLAGERPSKGLIFHHLADPSTDTYIIPLPYKSSQVTIFQDRMMYIATNKRAPRLFNRCIIFFTCHHTTSHNAISICSTR